MQSRRDVLHILTLCEITNLSQQRRADFKAMIEEYLDQQIGFYEGVRGVVVARFV